MKFIKKQFKDQDPPEPPRYTAWKNQENATLEQYYQSNNADRAWGHLHKVLPRIQEEDIVYFTKNELLDDFVLPEQGNICAYCNRQIHNVAVPFKPDVNFLERRASVEHVVAKSENPRSLTHSYQNLVAVCRGGEKIPPPRETHCDNKRNNIPLPLHPLMPECEQEILYIYDGQIVGLSARAENVIETLGLDNLVLKAHRAKEIAKWIFDINTDGNLLRISDESATVRFSECSSKNSDNKFAECCGPLLSVLKNEFNIKPA